MKKSILIFLTISFWVMNLCMVVQAAEIDEEKEIISGVLQMVVVYTDDDGKEYPIQGGSGFLIGDGESGAGYMITAYEVTSVSIDTAKQLIELCADEEEIAKLDYTVKVVIRRDVMIDAQLIAESEEMGFAIWKLSQPLYDRQSLILCDKELNDLMGQEALVLGFPTAPSLQTEAIYYTVDEMISQSGTFIGDGNEGNIKYLYHTVNSTQGMLGGPVLNENGEVVAINQIKEEQSGYYALQIAEVIPVLEAMGIPYTTTSQIEAQIQAELDAMVHKEELQNKIAEIEALDSNLYREESYNALIEILPEAIAINEDAEATQEEVDGVLERLNNGLLLLEERTPGWIIAVIVSSVVLGIGITVVVVLVRTRSKRQQRKLKKIEEMTVTQAAPIFTEQTIQKDDYKKLINPDNQYSKDMESIKSVTIEECYGETTVFQQENNDSMELHSVTSATKAYLIRKRNHEKIVITEKEFVLGKDASQTDYCISGNSAISRAHAVIICKDNEYEVADKNATNGTFVNDVKIAAFQKATLKNGDILRLADENFEFRITE